MRKILVTLLSLAMVSSIGTTALATTNEATGSNKQNSMSESLSMTSKTFKWQEAGRWQDAVISYNPDTKVMYVTSKSLKLDIPFNITHRSSLVGYGYQEYGDIVKAAQILLNIYLERTNQTRIKVDGYFGPATNVAIKKFQRGYTPNSVDGIIGQNTWFELYYFI